MQGGSHPAENDRLFISGLVRQQGISGETDLQVTQNTTPNMSVLVAAGDCFIAGTENANQGTYHGVNDAAVNLVVTGADPSNPRLDLVVARIRDSFYSGAFNDFTLQVVTGIAAASPVAPTAPANSITLARIQIPALATSIANANITDLRTKAGLWSGTTVCTSSTRPASPYTGQLIFETDTGKVQKWSGSAWVELLDFTSADTRYVQPSSTSFLKKLAYADLSGGAASSLAITSIPNTGMRGLFVEFEVNSVATDGSAKTLRCQINGNTGVDGTWSRLQVTGAGTITGAGDGTAGSTSIELCVLGTQDVSSPTLGRIDFPSGFDGSYNQRYIWQTSAALSTGTCSGTGSGRTGGSVISQVKLLTSDGSNLGTSSKMTIYGLTT